MRQSVVSLMLALGFAGLAGCEGSTEPMPGTNMRGILSWDDPPAFALGQAAEVGEEGHLGEPPALVAPDTVDAGSPFVVQATTILPNGCWQAGSVSVDISGNLATIEIYDRGPTSPEAVCILIYSWATRDVELQFDEVGEGIVRLVGRRIQGEDYHDQTEQTIEKTIVVR